MHAIAPELAEFEIQALAEYTFRRNGADGPSYGSIVGSGPNSTTLHYNKDDRFMKAGEMVNMDMAAYYGVPVTDEPDQITKQATGAPTADQVLDKYIRALGGAQKVAALTSYVARGSDLGYGDADPAPLQIFAKAPNQFSEVATTASGPRVRTFDGRAGYVTVPDVYTPLPKRLMTGGELEGAKLDAKNILGWTPLTIANGVMYTNFYKSQRHTATLLAKLMKERGMEANDALDISEIGRAHV